MSIHEKNDFDISNYDHMAVLMRHPNFNNDWQNSSESFSLTEEDYFYQQNDGFNSLPGLKGILYAIYISIFFIGICGNVLICYVVFRNKSMHTVTNFFIANLALSNILLCTFAVPFTSIYFFMSKWVFGRVLCHLVPYIEGASVYITAFTLMSIAIDRYLVTMYPFKPRLQLTSCYIIVLAVWILAGLLILPNGIFMVLVNTENGIYCDEVWPHESSRKAFAVLTLILQFVIPFIIIIFCYLNVCIDIKKHALSMPGAESFEKDEMERESTRRINRMLIIMVIFFYTSWLPFNIYNLTLNLS
ncbi:unnamed protein product [Larinioides sclopetarius]|uniref:G-protein coupled receptors family 1 profile domain-containing protein n=1 Tax=Larinioides sclopetarius TaxID=280406 RepID=A0AAV1ZHU0_9ARAC